MFTRPATPVQNAGLLSLLSVMILGGTAVLTGGLLVWGLWLAATQQGFDALGEMVNIGRAFGNGISGPWVVIWFIQIPVAYLAGLSLGFLRPLNRAVSQGLFLIFLVMAFFPAEALSIRWYMMARDMGIVNTTAMVGMAWLSSAFSLIVFKMFFDGALEKFNAAREAGQRTSDAFANTVFLPSLGIIVLVGAVLSFASLQSFLWPLISVNEEALRSLPVSAAVAKASYGAMQQSSVAALALVNVIISAVIFLPVFALLHVFVLERLSIVAGPPVAPELLMSGLRKAKNDDLSAGEPTE
jgi:ABC-type glycerol-3-phosphate transport system permease component